MTKQISGAKIRKRKLSLYMRDGAICGYCGRKFDMIDLTIDHIQARSNGGSINNCDNMVLACHTCNCRKQSVGIKTWLEREEARLILEKEKVRFTTRLVKNLRKEI